MFDLFLGLFNLFIAEFNHVLLLLHFLDGLFKLTLNLIQSAELMLQFVFFSGDFLYLLHQGSILIGQLFDVSLQLGV